MARKPLAPLSRRLVEAAVELSGNNPNRMVAIDAIVDHLGLPHTEWTAQAFAQAIEDGYLKPNAGKRKRLHTVSVTHKWRYEHAAERERK